MRHCHGTPACQHNLWVLIVPVQYSVWDVEYHRFIYWLYSHKGSIGFYAI